MNVSATLNAFRLLRNPSLCLPHATISIFNDLPLPLSTAFGNAEADVRAVVLDKDNCFAVPKENVVYQPYIVGCVLYSSAMGFDPSMAFSRENIYAFPVLFLVLPVLKPPVTNSRSL